MATLRRITICIIGMMASSYSLTATQSLQISSATYLGANEADSGMAVDIGNGACIVWAGRLAGQNFGQTPVNLFGGGEGAVVRFSSDGRSVLSITRLPSTVWDMEVNHASGTIAVAGAFGVACLSATANQAIWRDSLSPLSGKLRVSIGSDGTVGAINTSSGHVTLISSTGSRLAQFSAGGQYNNDIAMDGVSKLAIVAGFTQKNVSGFCMGQLQVPWVRAFDYTGAKKWTDYDQTAQETESTSSSCADSRGLFVTLGRDGKLYVVGRSDGGNTIFRYNPKGPWDATITGALTTTDWFTNPYNMNGAASVGFYGRFNPADGAIEAAQQLVVRLSTGKANTVRINNIDADESGNIYLCGVSACCMEFRDSLYINGSIKTGPYTGGDSWVYVASSDLKKRSVWMTFAGDTTRTGNKFDLAGIAVGNGIAATAGTASGGMITYQAVQATHSDSIKGVTPDGYMVVWPTAQQGVIIRRSDHSPAMTLKGDLRAVRAHAMVVGVDGRMVWKSSEQASHIIPGNLKPGIYFVITGDGLRAVRCAVQ